LGTPLDELLVESAAKSLTQNFSDLQFSFSTGEASAIREVRRRVVDGNPVMRSKQMMPTENSPTVRVVSDI
jgi:hypothetical protein